MKVSKVDVQDIRFFSKLIKDYLNQDPGLKDLYHRYPSLENFQAQIDEKKQGWKNAQLKRSILVDTLLEQYQNMEDWATTRRHIELLRSEHCFTITTGHQLNLFTGPLYFLYKIVSTINLCKDLRAAHPQNSFVPVYWMATEDHDFEEIQFFNYGRDKVVLDKDGAGAVGRMDTGGLDEIYREFKELLGNSDHALQIIELFKKSYLTHHNLADATRALAHELFKDDGLVIIDADAPSLKGLFVPTCEDELLHEVSYNAVSDTIDNWPDTYNIQVNPREINLFYLTDDYRSRIIKVGENYTIDGQSKSFTQQQILEELHNHPERFSPNVIMRPLYQETILPNLCYIGGGGELAYWLQLKEYFMRVKVVFPMLLLRNSALIVSSKQAGKLERLDLEMTDLFKEPHLLANQITRDVSKIDIDFSQQITFLKAQFSDLYQLAHKTEKSFETAVAAQEQKQVNGLEYLEKRLLKAQKRKLTDYVDRGLRLQDTLFPGGSLQERQVNFSFLYEVYGNDLIEAIKQSLDPLDSRFTVIEM
ncbi:MAG: bacillithiol biosynthesis cysteine-adding enzyme BshC [Nonlabens sp.]